MIQFLNVVEDQKVEDTQVGAEVLDNLGVEVEDSLTVVVEDNQAVVVEDNQAVMVQDNQEAEALDIPAFHPSYHPSFPCQMSEGVEA